MPGYFNFWPMIILVVGLVIAIVCGIAFANSGNVPWIFGIIIGIVIAILGIGLNISMVITQNQNRIQNVSKGSSMKTFNTRGFREKRDRRLFRNIDKEPLISRNTTNPRNPYDPERPHRTREGYLYIDGFSE